MRLPKLELGCWMLLDARGAWYTRFFRSLWRNDSFHFTSADTRGRVYSPASTFQGMADIVRVHDCAVSLAWKDCEWSCWGPLHITFSYFFPQTRSIVCSGYLVESTFAHLPTFIFSSIQPKKVGSVFQNFQSTRLYFDLPPN